MRRAATPTTRRIAATVPAIAATLAVALALALAARPSATRAASHDIDILDGAFQPAELTVLVGEPVTWTNRGSQVHTVTSDDGELDSGDNAPGEAYGHVFEVPGVYAYHCIHHPEMQGTITVLPAPATPVSSGSPEPTPPPGTLPPNFSPFPTTGPIPTPTPAPTAVPTPAPTAAPTSEAGDDGGDFAAAAAILAAVVAAGVAILLVRRGRRSA